MSFAKDPGDSMTFGPCCGEYRDSGQNRLLVIIYSRKETTPLTPPGAQLPLFSLTSRRLRSLS